MAYNEELDIRTLLERYLDGESSLTEEARLREYFCQNRDIPADLIYAKAMFVTFAASKQTRFKQAGFEPASEQVNFEPTAFEPKRKVLNLSKIMSMAASLLIGILVGGSIALINGHREEILARENTALQKIASPKALKHPPVYGYINGKPITDVHEACYRGAMELKTMGVQMRKPSRYLANFEVQQAGLKE